VVKLSISTSNTTRCPFMARNSNVTSMVKNCPITATDTPLTGSTIDAKPMPIWMAMIWPAITNAWKNSCSDKAQRRTDDDLFGDQQQCAEIQRVDLPASAAGLARPLR
jgi:hypothetical protein